MGPRILKSLLKTGAYPEPTGTVNLVQTHVSYIFITDSYVYKVKKEVDFGFLNFSTLDRRRFYCEEEVRLNRRLSPDLYVGVVELREAASGAAFTGNGKVVDYAVKMKRLPEEGMLHRLVDGGKATAEQMVRLAEIVARFHSAAEGGEEISQYGSPEMVHKNWDENFRMVQDFVNITISAKDLRAIRNWVEKYFVENERLILDRMQQGRVRECDGDLHMQNICIAADKIYIFDCIEFNERLRCSDTAADIAFLAMDLDYHGREDLRDLFLDAYEQASGDTSFRPLLDFYKGYRAFVRGKVNSLKIHDPMIPEPERKEAQKEAARHFRLARRYALTQNTPQMLIITCGLMGTGKSFLTRALSFDLGLPVIRTDAVRKRLFHGSAIDEGSGYNTGIYSPEATQATYDAVFSETAQHLEQGKSVIVDAAFPSEQERIRFRELAAARGARFYILKTSCPEKVVKKRLLERAEKNNDISDGRWELYHLHEQEVVPPAPDDPTMMEIDTTRPEAEMTASVLARMGLLS